MTLEPEEQIAVNRIVSALAALSEESKAKVLHEVIMREAGAEDASELYDQEKHRT